MPGFARCPGDRAGRVIPRRSVRARLTADELLDAVSRAGFSLRPATDGERDQLEAWLADRGYDYLNFLRAQRVVKMQAVGGVRAGYVWDD